MSRWHWADRLRWAFLAVVIGVLAAAWPAGQPAAGELDRLDTSLKLIPDDAAFYSSSLRNREKYDAVVNSRAWAKLREMPFVQMGLAMYKMSAGDPDSPPGQVQAVLKDPKVGKLLALAADMASHDVFCYGDASVIDSLELMQQIVGAMRYGPLMAQASGTPEFDQNKLQGRILLSALAQNADRIKVPDFVMGFKLSSPDAAKEQLKLLEKEAGEALEQVPELKGRLKKTKIGKCEYLTLSLDGNMIPWKEVPVDKLKEFEAKPGDAEKVLGRVKKMTLVVAVGLRDEYLLVSVGASTEGLAKLGSGKRLIDRPEMKPLEKHLGKRLASVGYMSKAMMARLGTGKKDISDLLEMVDGLLPLVELTADQQARIRKDAADLAEDVQRMIPEPGAMMGFSFLTDRGVESYQYNWGDYSRLDATKPLGLLQHVGGSPMLALVGRGKSSPADYDLMVKWIKKGYNYFEELAVPHIPPKEREQFQEFKKAAIPLVERLDKANRDMLIPALADGQAGLVIDAKLQSKHFVAALPATPTPLPMIEPAILVGVSDAALLRKGCEEYRAVINAFIDLVRKIPNSQVPDDFRLPEPKVTKSKSGTIYGYPLPAEWGVDKKIMPNFGLSDTVGVMTISRAHTERLLSATPLKVEGVLTAPDRPLAGAGVFQWAGLIDALTPWIDLALDQIASGERNQGQMAAVTEQVHTVLEVLKVFRSVTSESYTDGGALVTHSLLEIRDVAE